jgi:predicted phosphoadenosine phosphosulfate sulfurtransferase
MERKMPKIGTGVDVLTLAKERVKVAFNNFEKICISFSGGKDSCAMTHLVMEEAIKRDRKVAVLFIDMEAQYDLTVDLINKIYKRYENHIIPYWVCLPINLRNAVSVYEPFWTPWDEEKKDAWVRTPPSIAITDLDFFPFFGKGMEFEEFVPLFASWYSDGKSTAFFVGIRSDESYSRYRTIASRDKTKFQDFNYTTGVTESKSSFNFYPIYDWRTEDIWTYLSDTNLESNEIYNRMQMAGVPISQQRLCQPYGDDQRRGLWLFHLIEPQTWPKVVARVNGANSGSLYAKEHGNVNGYRAISKPPNLSWREFAERMVMTMPQKSRDHYVEKIGWFVNWWLERGYEDGIPNEAQYDLEIAKKVPSWRRICKTILRNDYFCKGLGFTQPKSDAYKDFLKKQKTDKLSRVV